MRPVAFATPTLTSALADDPAALRAAIAAGRSAVAPLPRTFSGYAGVTGRSALAARRTPGPDELFADDDPTLRILGPHGRTLLSLATPLHEALEGSRIPRKRIGLFLALGMVDSPPQELARAVDASTVEGSTIPTIDHDRFYAGAFRQIHPLWPLSMLGNVAGGQLAIDLDIRGDNLALASECDGGVRALLEATRAIRHARIDAALVGAVAEPVTPASLTRLALRAPVAHADVPGLAPGEGAVCLWLEAADTCPAARGRIVAGTTRFEPELREGRVLARALSAWLDDQGRPELCSVRLVPHGDPLIAARQQEQVEATVACALTSGTAAHTGDLGPAAALLELALAGEAPGYHLVVSSSSTGALGFLLVEVD